jgi:hypothetical protein
LLVLNGGIVDGDGVPEVFALDVTPIKIGDVEGLSCYIVGFAFALVDYSTNEVSLLG